MKAGQMNKRDWDDITMALFVMLLFFVPLLETKYPACSHLIKRPV